MRQSNDLPRVPFSLLELRALHHILATYLLYLGRDLKRLPREQQWAGERRYHALQAFQQRVERLFASKASLEGVQVFFSVDESEAIMEALCGFIRLIESHFPRTEQRDLATAGLHQMQQRLMMYLCPPDKEIQD